ncbi:LCP family protein [Micromonospora sp. NBC_01699]|uniref:LCP family protein n=1 Tax=Micromonospora sp. NBC_01699 TaxID=2975984 RepID=UPI002E2DBE8A|nr:LCP family protein [Micromonospora sp. NBC_01699]
MTDLGTPTTHGRRRKTSAVPRWARICTIFGTVLIVLSGVVLVGFEALLSRYQGAVASADLFGDEGPGSPPPKVSDIKGPINILLVGIDPRQPSTPPLADSIMILHVPAGMDRAYLFSMPRDLRVDIPAFPEANYAGGNDRLNAAMSHGSLVPGKNPDAAKGFELLQTTISNYTGIKRFDAGAILNFGGFKKIVDAMGGVDMYIDADTKSEHLRPDGTPRPGNPNGEGYIGPQREYKKGQTHLNGWQALDYVRQRKTLVDGDYGRQRHQQQFIRAMASQALSRDVVTNPLKLDAVLRAAGQSLIFSGRGHSVADWAFALRDLRADSMTLIKLPHSPVGTASNYQGEQLKAPAPDFFASVQADTLDTFVAAHPDLINTDK